MKPTARGILAASAAGLRTPPPGVSLDGPLGAPDPDHLGLPGPKRPQAAVFAPLVRTVPTSDLETGSGA
ncbi:hypothetical protein ACFYW9_05130 [Streptomyces sp. NPDC002698]|uniref:hypothetical protein n=1 Tax=Streptomyces sp. NPDC002698 TaxID=3364660 RepID=UPI003679A312